MIFYKIYSPIINIITYDIKRIRIKLSEMYNKAPKGESVAMIHLFGIKYAIEINQSNYSKKDIIV